MHYVRYQKIQEFSEAVEAFLLENEAQNLLFLGNLRIGLSGKDKSAWRDPAKWYMAAVFDEDARPILAALMTPPYNLTLHMRNAAIDTEAITLLIQESKDWEIPGVTAESALAKAFAKEFEKMHHLQSKVLMRQKIRVLDTLRPLSNETDDSKYNVRPADERDLSFLPFWLEDFVASTTADSMLKSPESDLDSYKKLIEGKQFYVLEENGTAKSITAVSRRLDKVSTISNVYTPPYFRQKGYASYLVRQVSKSELAKGYTQIVLYTDADYATSNHIYEMIGFEELCDSLMLGFF